MNETLIKNHPDVHPRLILSLKLLILLSPLPFGCAGIVFTPLFYLSLLIFSYFAWFQLQSLKSKMPPAGKPAIPSVKSMLYEDKLKWALIVLFIFIVIQLIPLPFFLIKIISPGTAQALLALSDVLPSFHSISLIPSETLLFGFKGLVFAAFFYVLLKLQFSKNQLLSITNAIILSGFIQSVLGLIKYILGSDYFFLFFYPDKSEDIKRLTGTLANPNHFAFYLEMILPLTLGLLFINLKYLRTHRNLIQKFVTAMNTDKKVLFYLVAIVFLTVAIFLTGSRSGILITVLSFLVFSQLTYFVSRSRTYIQRLKYIFIIATLFAVFIGLQHTAKRFMDSKIDNSGRFLRWPNTIDMVKQFPIFGSGFATYRYAYYLYDTDKSGKWSDYAHNDYLETLADSGIFGSMIYLGLFSIIIFSIVRMWLSRRHPEIKMLGIGVLTAIFAVVCHSLLDFSLHIPANFLIFILLLVLGIKFSTYKHEF